MAFPKVKKESILKALKKIREEGVPKQYRSKIWDLVDEDNKKYPVKYVIYVAYELETGNKIDDSEFVSSDAYTYLKKMGFKIQKNEYNGKSLDDILHLDEESTEYKNGMIGFTRSLKWKEWWKKNEYKCTNLNFTYSNEYGKENGLFISLLQDMEDKNKWILISIDKLIRKNNETKLWEHERLKEFDEFYGKLVMVYDCDKKMGEQFAFNIDTYYNKLKIDKLLDEIYPALTEGYNENKTEPKGYNKDNAEKKEDNVRGEIKYKQPYTKTVLESKNVIFRGAPGTGKTYLAKQIAADIISEGKTDKFNELSPEQKLQVEFVQFHPSYDYTDFVEGLRPKTNDDGTIGFELKDGIFKQFIDKARKNFEISNKASVEVTKSLIYYDSILEKID